MSLGFSVGDVLTVTSLAKDVCLCLRDIGGSRTEYQDLERELDCLQKALAHLDKLQSSDSSTTIDSIRFAAFSCRRPLEDFLRKIRKYEASLGPGATRASFQAQVDKVRFRFGLSDDIRKLQNYLNVHIGTINILLTEHGLETMMLASEESETERREIRQRLDDTQQLLRQVQDNVSTQTATIFNAMSILAKVHAMVSGEIRSPFLSMKDIVAKACVSTQQIYTVVLDIKASLTSRLDTRWSFFQDPLVCEDALGRKFPVPSEYDFAMLNTIVRQRFQTGPGSMEVGLGDFEIADGVNRSLVLSESSYLRPGSSLIMSILIENPPSSVLTDEACPMPQCASNTTRKADGGGRFCCRCNVWFTATTKKRRAMLDLWEASVLEQDPDRPVNSTRTAQNMARKRHKTADSHESMRAYKNVSLADNAAGPSESTNAPTAPVLNDALQYLDNLKIAVHSTPEKYDRFLDIITHFRTGKLDTFGTGFEVLKLFGEHEDLVEGFNCFMPPGWSLDFATRSVTDGRIRRTLDDLKESDTKEDSLEESEVEEGSLEESEAEEESS